MHWSRLRIVRSSSLPGEEGQSWVRLQILTTPELLAASSVLVCGFQHTAEMKWAPSACAAVAAAAACAGVAPTGGVAKSCCAMGLDMAL